MPNELDYSGLDPNEEWTEPSLHGDTQDDFGVPDSKSWDELSDPTQDEIEDNFLLGENVSDFGDLNLPVVDPEGDVDPSDDQLSKQGLQAADAYVHQTEGYPQEMLEETDAKIQRLQQKFD